MSVRESAVGLVPLSACAIEKTLALLARVTSLVLSVTEMPVPCLRVLNCRSTPDLALKTDPSPVPTLEAVFASPVSVAAIVTSFTLFVIMMCLQGLRL